MRLLITGDRKWTDYDMVKRGIERQMRIEPIEVVIHGGAAGADTLAGEVAASLGIPVLVFAAQWDQYGRAAGPVRNQQMLDVGLPTHVLAFHPFLPASKGTADMIRRARKAGLPVTIVSGRADDEDGS